MSNEEVIVCDEMIDVLSQAKAAGVKVFSLRQGLTRRCLVLALSDQGRIPDIPELSIQLVRFQDGLGVRLVRGDITILGAEVRIPGSSGEPPDRLGARMLRLLEAARRIEAAMSEADVRMEALMRDIRNALLESDARIRTARAEAVRSLDALVQGIHEAETADVPEVTILNWNEPSRKWVRAASRTTSVEGD